MTKLEKLIAKIMNGQNVSYKEAKTLLERFGFSCNVEGSHFVFRKPRAPHISLKRTRELLPYQLRFLQKMVDEHED